LFALSLSRGFEADGVNEGVKVVGDPLVEAVELRASIVLPLPVSTSFEPVNVAAQRVRRGVSVRNARVRMTPIRVTTALVKKA
jgi:hypothetical protein